MKDLLPWLVIPAAWLLGGVSPGYWLVRLRTGGDVRAQGSGATGATNAARALGRGGFVVVLALDALKGAVAAGGARLAGLGGGWEFAAGAAVVAGHVWPVQLGFKGGRGFGPLLGAWLVLAPLAIGGCLALAGVGWAVTRKKVFSALGGALVLPGAVWLETRAAPAAGCTAMAFAIIAWAHRAHFSSPPASGSAA